MITELTPDRVKLGITPTLWWNDDFPAIDIGIPFGEAVSEMALAGFQAAASATSTRPIRPSSRAPSTCAA